MSQEGTEENELKRPERRQLRADPESPCSAFGGDRHSMLKKKKRAVAGLTVFIGGMSAPEDHEFTDPPQWSISDQLMLLTEVEN